MKQNTKWLRLLFVGAAILILTPIILAFDAVGSIQGYGKVINYTCVLRGSIQRIVKSELQHKSADDLVNMIDDVLLELKQGGPIYDIVPMRDAEEYQSLLAEVSVLWQDMKIEMNQLETGGDSMLLFEQSEQMFLLCNDAVFAAEHYSEHKIWQLKRRMMLSIFLLLLSSAILLVAYRREQRRIQHSAEQLLALDVCVPGGIQQVRLDDRRTLEYVSDGLLAMTGYTRQELHRQFQDSLMLLVPEEERTQLRESILRQLLHRPIIEVEYHLQTKDGGQIHIVEKGKLIGHAGADRPNSVLYSLLIDMTQREKERLSRLQNEERYRIIMMHTKDIVFEWDKTSKRAYSSPNYKRRFGYALPEDRFFTQEGSVRVYEEDRAAYCAFLKQFEEGKTQYENLDCRLLDAQGKAIWCSIRATAIQNEKGETERIIGIVSDVDAQKRKLLRLEHAAQRDGLTGLYNKSTTEDIIRNFLEEEGRKDSHVLYLIDVDDFKQVNDSSGHERGDEVLCLVSSTLESLFRGDDIIGRVGGDEFMALVKGVSDEQVALRRAQMIRDAFVTTANGTYHVSVSVGAAMFPADGCSFAKLCRRADAALYASKRHGKNCATLYAQLPPDKRDGIEYEHGKSN